MWLEQSEQRGEKEEERTGRVWGRSCRALWAMRRTWAFTCGRWEPWRAVSSAMTGPDWSAQGALSWLLQEGQMDMRAGVREGPRLAVLVQVGDDEGWTN